MAISFSRSGGFSFKRKILGGILFLTNPSGIKTLSFKMFLNHCMDNRPKIKPRLLKLLKESTGDYLNNFKADKKLLEKKTKALFKKNIILFSFIKNFFYQKIPLRTEIYKPLIWKKYSVYIQQRACIWYM